MLTTGFRIEDIANITGRLFHLRFLNGEWKVLYGDEQRYF